MDADWDQSDIKALLKRMDTGSEDLVVRMAVFKMQEWVTDPSWADRFVKHGGLVRLRSVIMRCNGNTVAYAMQALTRLLEMDKGWEIFEDEDAQDFIERVVEIVVKDEKANIVRSAMSVCVAIVSHPSSCRKGANRAPGSFGLRALKPAIAVYPRFFEKVAVHLRAEDHSTCGNALMMLNALMRDAMMPNEDDRKATSKSSGTGEEWPTFVNRMWKMGVNETCYNIMHSAGAADIAVPLLDCQIMLKYITKKQKDMKVDYRGKPEHNELWVKYYNAAKEAVAKDSKANELSTRESTEPPTCSELGFLNNDVESVLKSMGFLGLRDLAAYAERNADQFVKHLQEQALRPITSRCPVATASADVTRLLFEFYNCAEPKADEKAIRNRQSDENGNSMGYDGPAVLDKLFRPALFHWPRLHAAGVNTFIRLWKETGAKAHEFQKVSDLVQVLLREVFSKTARRADISAVEHQMAHYDCHKLRAVQRAQFDIQIEDHWQDQLMEIRATLTAEAISFLAEQRIMMMQQGFWFFLPAYFDGKTKKENKNKFRYVILSPSRRFLHYDDYAKKPKSDPQINNLSKKIDTQQLSSVRAIHRDLPDSSQTSSEAEESSPRDSVDSASTIRGDSLEAQFARQAAAKKALMEAEEAKRQAAEARPFSHLSLSTLQDPTDDKRKLAEELEILTLHQDDQTQIAEWLDGLLALLGMRMVTWQSDGIVNMIVEQGLQMRMLNLRVEDMKVNAETGERTVPEVPSRRGLDKNYYYADTSEGAEEDGDVV